MTYREAVHQATVKYLKQITRGRKVSEAAKAAGVNRTHFYRLCDRLGVKLQKSEQHVGNWNGC